MYFIDFSCTSVDSLQAFIYVDGRLEKVDMFCGVNLPKPIMSNGPKLMLEFRGTLSSRHARGFKISYSFVESKYVNIAKLSVYIHLKKKSQHDLINTEIA